ncbi:MAG: thioesterase [Lachnospiraceae bacterium]
MYTLDGRIRYSEVDENGRIDIPGIINYFQDCSTFHSEDIGLGYKKLEKKKKVWLLSSWQVIVERYPVLGEAITVSTFATGFKGLYGTRNFVMKDCNDIAVAYANSIWVFMDVDKGRPVKPQTEDIEKYGVEPAWDMEYQDRKIKTVGTFSKAGCFPVRTYYLDTNHHVNNCWYIHIAMEALEHPISIRQVRVEYKKAAVYGEIIYARCAYESERTVVELCSEEEELYARVEFIGEK